MKRSVLVCSLFLFVIYSCTSPKYIYDSQSLKRQKELKNSRAGNTFASIGLSLASLFVMTALDTDVGYFPTQQKFKRLKLKNPTSDTIYVNMLTDVYWDNSEYCDFMDIRIPPQKNCKVLVPVDALYNLYYSNTPESDDDEVLEIFTSDIKKVEFKPGLFSIADTLLTNK